MAIKNWKIKSADDSLVKTLQSSLGLCSLAAKTLASRGCSTAEQANELLTGAESLGDPLMLADMAKAAQRINLAIERDETIAVFGDYDVDGITSTALMLNYLFSRGASAVCSLPERESTGYGLSKQAVDNFKKCKASLIITVDNGISAHEEIAYANSYGIDVIVCDHHLPPETLPPAYAVIDPLRQDDESAFKQLAGVGVALKLIAAVEGCPAEEMLDEFGYLAAIGTIADIMPMVGENRLIVRRGLEGLQWCDNLGLNALCEKAGISLSSLDSESIAFTLAPRLNAAGRMDSASLALRLLISDDLTEAQQLAERLDELNRERQAAETEAAKQVSAAISQDPDILRRPVIVVAGEGLHSGVIGIVCSRLVDKYGKPAIIISTDGDDAKGSGRGVDGFSLHAAIAECAPVLIKFGGHEMAAGFMLNTADVPRFKELLFAHCAHLPSAPPMPSLSVDSEVELAEINEGAVRELETLAPFGREFAQPVFYARGLTVQSVAPLGARHTRLTLSSGRLTLSGAWFSIKPDDVPFAVGATVDAAFSLSIYEGAARASVSVRFCDIHPAGITEKDFAELELYRSLSADINIGADACGLKLTRQDVADIYRACRAKGICRDDLRALAVAFPKLGMARALVALDVLEQLGLCETAVSGGSLICHAVANPPRRDLNDSEIFCIVNAAADAD